MSLVDTLQFDPLANADKDAIPYQSHRKKEASDGSKCASSKPTNPKDVMGVDKVPMSTVSAPVLAELGVAMLEGAAKYGRHNYRVVGVRASIYYDATMRHLMGWWEGQDIDPDSRMSHITKAISSLVVLRDAMINGKLEDDRPPACPEFYAALNLRVKEIRDTYSHITPKHYTWRDTDAKSQHIPEDILVQTFAPLEQLTPGQQGWDKAEARMNVVAQNGNTGEHYVMTCNHYWQGSTCRDCGIHISELSWTQDP